MSYKVVIDSCGELLDEWKQDPRFESVALTLSVDGVNIIDDETFDQADFLKRVAECPECPKSACPSPERYMRAFDCEAEHVYAVTLSAELSGSYNSAVLGKNLLQEDHPDRQIHIFNSKSASVGQTLIAMKIQECEEAGLPFEQVIEKINQQYAGDFTDGDKVVITTLHEKLKNNKKLMKAAKTDGRQIFEKNIFPQLFDDAAQEAYVESTETYTKLFEDAGKYRAIMNALAQAMFDELKNGTING